MNTILENAQMIGIILTLMLLTIIITYIIVIIKENPYFEDDGDCESILKGLNELKELRGGK